MMILFLLLVASVFSLGSTIPDEDLVSSCHAVTYRECVQFNYSTIPNINNDEVSDVFRDMRTLLASGCSKHAQILACFMLVPICHEHSDIFEGMEFVASFRIYPCRSFCFEVQQECSDYKAFWALNCSSVPIRETCFGPPPDNDTDNNVTNGSTPNGSATTITPTTVTPITTITPIATIAPIATITPIDNKTVLDMCPGRLIPYQGVSYGGVDDCAAPCHYLYEEDSHSSGLVTFLFVTWSVFLLLAFISFVSFLLTWKHYSHIEQPYHFVALCHAFMFLAFLIRLGSGHDGMVCDTSHSNVNGTALVTEDISNAACTTVFVIVYYSLIAIGIWLVNLSFALCARTLAKWKDYLLVGYHLAGWVIPLIFVIAACALKMVSGESLLGMCQLDDQYLAMLLVPLFTSSGLSFILLLFAVLQMLFCSQACAEVQHKHPGRFVRSLIFGVIVLIEISVISVLYLIEYVTYEHWETYYTECVARPSPEPDCPGRTFTKPSNVIPVLRYSLLSLVGAVSIAWPLARRVTWQSWKDTASLLYRKVVDTFRKCSWRSKSKVIIQLVS